MFDPVFYSCACPVSALRYTRNSWTPGWFWLQWRLGQTEIAFIFTLTLCRCSTTSPSTGSTTSSSMLMLCTCSRMYPGQWLGVISCLLLFSTWLLFLTVFAWYCLYQSTSAFLRKLQWYLTPVFNRGSIFHGDINIYP